MRDAEKKLFNLLNLFTIFRNAILFTRKQQAVLKRPELQMKDDSTLGAESIRDSAIDIKGDEKKKSGRGRKTSARKSTEAANEQKKAMLLTPAVIPNTNITLETPKFDAKIPDSFRLYRGQGSNSENSEGSDFSDSCTSCVGFSESYTNSEYGSSGEDVSDSEIVSENNSDSETLPPERITNDDESQGTTIITEKKDEEKESESRHSHDTEDNPVALAVSSTTLRLRPLQLVWAKSRGYPWYPALIIDPDIPKGFVHNSVPLPCPPQSVLDRRKNQDDEFLVLFFDAKRTWQFLPESKLVLLGIDNSVDEGKLMESKKPADRKAVKKAYEEALHFLSQVSKKKPEGKL